MQALVDAVFAGTWNLAESDLLTSSLSSSGHVIKIANCPVHWVSAIQSKVALSATEAACIPLSQSTRDLMPIRQMIEFCDTFIKIDSKTIITYSTVFEENNEALQLVLEPKHRPCTKHTCVKYHHFR